MTQKLHIYYTTDTHGHVLPVDYASGKQTEGGLLSIAGQIHKDGNTLVLDGGDSLQGTPLIAFYLEHGGPVHPVAAAFNAMGLDYYTLGNHDFNFGYEAVRDYVKAMNATLLCANVEDLGGEIPIRKWAVHTLESGLRVGLTGAVTDWVNVWEKKEHLEKLRVTDAFSALRDSLAQLRGRCDITVCIYHGGYERDLHTGKKLSESNENIACRIGAELDFDILLTGHQHMAVENVTFGNTFSCQCPDKAISFIDLRAGEREQVRERGNGSDHVEPQAGAEIVVDEDRRDSDRIQVNGLGREQVRESSSGADRVWQVSSHLVKAVGPADAHRMQRLAPLEQAVERWLDEPIGHFPEAIAPEEKLDAALHGSKVAALFNQVQLEETGADISCTSLGNDPIGFKEIVSIRDIYTAYPFANTSVVKSVTGKVLREALEHCASYFTLENGKPRVSDYFLKPKVEHYNFDFYAGLDYAFDIRKTPGKRVVRMARLDGTPIGEEDVLKLVTSDYRATGTGGYEMLGRCPVVWTGADNVQDLLVEYIRSQRELTIPDNVRYRVIW